MRNADLVSKWSLTLFMAIAALVVNMPIILMVLNSLQSTAAIIARENFFPRDPSLQNYRFLMAETPFLTYLRNSILTAVGATTFSLCCAVFAGYALSRFRNRLLDIYATALFAVQMFPIILAL